MLGKIVETGQDTIYVKLVEKSNFKLGEEVTVSKAKKIRTVKQNAFLWVFYEWLINPFGGDMQSHGHFSTDGLHESVKQWIEDNHSHDFIFDEKFSTRELTRQEFKKFFDFVSEELFVDKLKIDTSGFWIDYDRLTTWKTTNPGGMSAYLEERSPF